MPAPKYKDQNTGQAYRPHDVTAPVTTILIPEVGEADLMDMHSNLNQSEISGKQAGAMVFFQKTTYIEVATAEGHLNNDKWGTYSLSRTITPS